MPVVTPEIENYFHSLQARLAEAELVPFKQVSLADWQPKLSDCHNNVDYWTAHRAGCTRVRGWLTCIQDESGLCYFIAHSVVEQEGTLYDITPIDPSTPRPRFLKHLGKAAVFDSMQPAWCSTFYPFLTGLLHIPASDDDADYPS